MVQFLIVENIGKLITMEGALRKRGRSIVVTDLGVIENATMIIELKKGKIVWTGPSSPPASKKKKIKRVNAQGGTVIPGFVDSHTHLVFDGDRSEDFEKRLQGWSYQKIAEAGGGILTTMNATREASFGRLLKLARARIKNAKNQGVTTMEIKTGYGLSFDSEKKLLEVISELKKVSGLKIKSTFLAAHAVPPEFAGRRKDYIEEICLSWLPKLKKHIDFVDVFLDQGFFDREDAVKLFETARKLKIPTRIHADEIALTGGADVAVKYQSLSADHLLKISDKEIKALAESEVTATLLPTTAFFLQEPYAPARKLLDCGARVALASDLNPGTSPTQDISLVGLLAALELKMRPEEILAALTLSGAFALGLEKSKGALLPGYDADFILTPFKSPTGLFYQFGQRPIDAEVFIGGVRV